MTRPKVKEVRDYYVKHGWRSTVSKYRVRVEDLGHIIEPVKEKRKIAAKSKPSKRSEKETGKGKVSFTKEPVTKDAFFPGDKHLFTIRDSMKRSDGAQSFDPGNLDSYILDRLICVLGQDTLSMVLSGEVSVDFNTEFQDLNGKLVTVKKSIR